MKQVRRIWMPGIVAVLLCIIYINIDNAAKQLVGIPCVLAALGIVVWLRRKDA